MLDVKRNLTTMTDFYELTMSAGYLDEGYKDKIAVFDMFFRKVPDGGGYAIMAGLEQFINAVDSLKLPRKTSIICAPPVLSMSSFWTICATLSCTAISGRLKRACPSSRRSPL